MYIHVYVNIHTYIYTYMSFLGGLLLAGSGRRLCSIIRFRIIAFLFNIILGSTISIVCI